MSNDLQKFIYSGGGISLLIFLFILFGLLAWLDINDFFTVGENLYGEEVMIYLPEKPGETLDLRYMMNTDKDLTHISVMVDGVSVFNCYQNSGSCPLETSQGWHRVNGLWIPTNSDCGQHFYSSSVTYGNTLVDSGYFVISDCEEEGDDSNGGAPNITLWLIIGFGALIILLFASLIIVIKTRR